MNHLLLTRTKKLFANKFASLTTDTITIIILGNGEGRQGRGTKVRPPKGWPRRVEGPKIGRFFFPLRHNFLSFSPLLEVFSWNCGGVFHTPGPSNVHVLWRERGKKSEIFGQSGGEGGPGRGRSTKTKKIIPARGYLQL